MTDDIVERLRDYDFLVSEAPPYLRELIRRAAHEIEQLRFERDGFRDGNRQTLAALAEANEIAKRYKAERDSARRSVYEMTLKLGTVFRRVNGKTVEVTTPDYVADLMDWDCFKEER